MYEFEGLVKVYCPKVKRPAAGLGFRMEVRTSISEHLDEIEVLEITVDHYLSGGPVTKDAIKSLSLSIPMVAHGVGLSVGTAIEPDSRYLEGVAEVLEAIGAPWHSEHLAFTKVPGRDLAALLPLPRTREVAEAVVANLTTVLNKINKPIALENITYHFEYPESELSEVDFIKLICRESGAFLLLDVENLYLNSKLHGYDPVTFIDNLPPGLVKGVHVAGGITEDGIQLDSHSEPVPNPVLDLVGYLLKQQQPDTVILERDENLVPFEEVLTDFRRVKEAVVGSCAGF
jgi:uncharacterized protein (UPF0276 family)